MKGGESIMAFKITEASHLDHGLTEAQIDFLKKTFADKAEFFIETVELPAELGIVYCGLFGPIMGDEPVPEADVFYAKRGEREHDSRMVKREQRPTRKVTVIAGEHEGEPCVLFTAFGGPLAPKEPQDTEHGSDERSQSEDFWSQHALAE